jgi:hypothetical protein
MNLIALRDTWLMFQREHGCSVDRMLCRPALREEFIAAARAVCGCDDEESILWETVNLRKKKSLASASKPVEVALGDLHESRNEG